MEDFTIILFKSKHSTDSSDWDEMTQKDLSDERNEFMKAAKHLVKKLKSVDSDNYIEMYKKGVEKLFEFSSLPIKHFDALHVSMNRDEGYAFDVVEPDALLTMCEKIKNALPLKDVCVFDDSTFINNFFKPYYVNNACWLNEEIINNGIKKCTDVITTPKKAADILPSDEKVYDKEYLTEVREFRKSLKHVLKVMGKKYAVYALYLKNKNTVPKNTDMYELS